MDATDVTDAPEASVANLHPYTFPHTVLRLLVALPCFDGVYNDFLSRSPRLNYHILLAIIRSYGDGEH